MFKSLVKITVLLFLFVNIASAQSNKTASKSTAVADSNPFTGKWELVGISADAGYSYQKLFTDAGDFSNYRITTDGVVKTHFGKYVIKDKTTYFEIVSMETDASRSHVAGQTTTIIYKFSEDNKLLTIKGLAINGNSDFQETWKRIDVPVVTAIPLTTANIY